VVTGAVLAGGESRRFGRNKALEPYRGKRFIDHCVESLRLHCGPLLVVANDLSLYYDVHATLVRDVLPHQGPLGGIYTALLFSPWDWVLVKATDMPFLVPELVTLLLQTREQVDVVVPTVAECYEPLLALYHRRCLPAIADTLQREERRIIDFYRKVKVRAVSEAEWRPVDPQGRSFWNMNTPEEWQQLQQN
jgi:molybdopterin-guanine dinucleotide biosynthesis protein A